MKQNGYDKIPGNYYIGLDIGTDSVGWAVTDEDYNICRFKGNSMWGIRLFEEGETAQTRRSFRAARRRLARRKQRMELVRLLFNNEITKVDPCFFQRMADSSLIEEHKTTGCKYSLFNDPKYTDKDYMKQYKTIYHLRQDLIKNKEPHDVRLVYLALHHIMKSRGHFLFDLDDSGNDANSFVEIINELKGIVNEVLSIELDIADLEALHAILLDKQQTKKDRMLKIKELYTCKPINEEETEASDIKDAQKKCEKLFSYIIGLKVKLADLFGDSELTKSINADTDLEDESISEDINLLGDRVALLDTAKAVYDSIKLEEIMGNYKYLSDYKVAEYNQHKEDIKKVKEYLLHINDKSLYKKIFVEKNVKYANYPAYSGYKKGDSEFHCTSEEFCKFLKDNLPGLREYDEEVFRRIEEGTFARKLRTSENGIIPNGLHRKELKAILTNAAEYLPFLNEKDVDGLTTAEKIYSIFDYRIPFYVGPLNKKSNTGWVVRREDKIYPWNFNKVVDLEESAEGFIIRMTNKCTYTGDDVIPKDSLLYSEYMLLNEINKLKVNETLIPVDVKNRLVEELFKKKDKKFTKKDIYTQLLSWGLINKNDEISGVADQIKASLSSYHKLARIRALLQDDELVEEIIRRIVLFGEDKKLLRNWLKKNVKALSQEDMNYISKLKFKEWGALSRTFLTKIQGVDKSTGEVTSIIEALRNNNKNLMELLSDKYDFYEKCEEYRKEHYEVPTSPYAKIEDLYVSPKIKRSIRQTFRIVDEIIDTKKSAPKKIFIEVARDQEGKNEKKETDSRKAKLIQLYKAAKADAGELYDSLCSEEEARLRQDKLFFYYVQFGKCMYSGKPIDLEDLQDNGKWDIDHIYPRSKIKDDSIDNRVLVDANLNRAKTNTYPISEDIRVKMRGIWEHLRWIGAISPEKYARLIRHTPLTDEELSQFVNRQLVETRQSTKAVAELFTELYAEAKTKIVYSKAGNVSEFRKHYKFLKCREINDHHHAQDAYLNVVVGNFFDTKFTDRFFKNIKSENYSLNPDALYSFDVAGAWKAGEEGTIATVRKMMAKNNVLFTRMPYEKKGQLYKVTIMKKGLGQIQVKQGKEIEIYGGYNKASGAYFSLVEHTVKKKRVRTIEAILICDKQQYESSPIKYFERKGLIEPVIIVDKILIDSVIELDGVRLHISGRTGTKIVYKHTYQFVVPNEIFVMIRDVEKYIARCTTAKRELSTHFNDGITKDNNERIYDFFINKIKSVKAYQSLFSPMLTDLEENQNKYRSMLIYEQCKILVQILKAFKCNAEKPSFMDLCGKGAVGSIFKTKDITASKSVALINQSITGLYETKIDLLK